VEYPLPPPPATRADRACEQKISTSFVEINGGRAEFVGLWRLWFWLKAATRPKKKKKKKKKKKQNPGGG